MTEPKLLAGVPQNRHQRALAAGCRCDLCPLCDVPRCGPVYPEVRTARIAVIGEAPGNEEVEKRRPFVETAPSGRVVDRALASEGFRRNDVTVTNVLLCRPPEDLDDYLKRCRREGKNSPVDCCWHHLKTELANVPALLPLGKVAYETVVTNLYSLPLGKKNRADPERPNAAKLSIQRGHPYQLPDGTWLITSYHPAHALRSARHFLAVIRDDIRMACRIARTGKPNWTEPDWSVAQTVEEIDQWCKEARQANAQIMVDIETAGLDPSSTIRCIGLGKKVGTRNQILVVPLYHLDDMEPYWDLYQFAEVQYHVRRLLEANPLAFQNGSFDTSVLLEQGWMTSRTKTWDDLAIVHHSTREQDCPHNLSFIASRFMEVRLWKGDVDHKASELSADDVPRAKKEYYYHRYNAYDVDAQMQSLDGTKRWLAEDGGVGVYEIDQRLAPVARDMGLLGLCIDVEERAKMAAICDEKIAEVDIVLRDLTGIADFNPDSPKQVGDWLYKTQHCPKFDAAGDLADQDAGGSTGEKALLKLLDHGVSEKVAEFVDKLLIHRGYAKIKGTYLTDRHTKPHPEFPGLHILNPTFCVFGTATGRFSSSPNVQNWPSRGLLNLKKTIVAPPGHVFVGADFEQVEARIFAVEAGDEIVLEALRTGKDIHSTTAARLFADMYKDVDAETLYQEIQGRKKFKESDPARYKKLEFIRTVAKTIRFSTQYGAGTDKLFAHMSTLRDKATNERLFPHLLQVEVEKWHKKWKLLNPWTKRWQDGVIADMGRCGYVEEHFHHRKRWFKDGSASPNEPPNHQIQGCAAAMANEALLRIAERIPYQGWSRYSGPILQVHDQIVVCVPVERVDEAKDIVVGSMSFDFRGVHIGADAGVGTRLSEV